MSVLTLIALPAAAKNLGRKEVDTCRWGAEVARQAQQNKLAGATLWHSRQALRAHHYAQPWMPRMALGITEQTYASPSRMPAAEVRQVYFDGCMQHQLTRR